MKDYKAYLIDLDGTIYRGDQTIQSGVDFVDQVVKKKKDYLFLTNNTTRTPKMVVEKLKKHGITTDESHVYTPSMATASYILQHDRNERIGVYIIGEIGLFKELLQHDRIELEEISPDYVIVGLDYDLTYNKIRIATKAIRKGATFIGTNADVNIPIGSELAPGNGAQCQMIAIASGQIPLYIGKPEAIIVDKALSLLNCKPENAVIVGDNYNTDIKAGFNSGVDQILTLTGITDRSYLEGKRKPTYVVNNLDELIDEIK